MTLDILLGGMDGFEVLRAIRDDPELRRTPVIVVSVLAGQETLAAEWSVTKPIDAEELTDAIGSAILASRARVLVVGRSGDARGGRDRCSSGAASSSSGPTSGAEAARHVRGDPLRGRARRRRHARAAGRAAPSSTCAGAACAARSSSSPPASYSPGLARLDPDPVPVEDATQAVVEALRTSTAVESGQ